VRSWAAALVGAAVLAREPIRVDVNQVLVPAVVTDARGRYMRDLRAVDFEVLGMMRFIRADPGPSVARKALLPAVA
jgi:hypothetical protein